MAKNWIASAGLKSGGLHKTLGLKSDAKITDKEVARAKAMGGKAAKQAALAETFRGMRHHRPNFES